MNCWRLSTGKRFMQEMSWRTFVACLSRGAFLLQFIYIKLLCSCRTELRRMHIHHILQYFYEQCTKYYRKAVPFTFDDVKRAYNFAYPFCMTFYAQSVPVMGNSVSIVGEEGEISTDYVTNIFSQMIHVVKSAEMNF